jgi:diguanylate cyclase (GGDEF)-like protein
MNQENGAVLVVEKDPEEGQELITSIEKKGEQVTKAQSNSEALALLKETYHPMVVASGSMADHRELCQSIRELDLPGYVFIILIISEQEKEKTDTTLQAEADECLVHPFGEAELGVRLHTGRRVVHLEKSLEDSYEQVEQVTTMDPLTAVYSRNYISTHLANEIAQASRYSKPLSVVLCDLDHFRHVNDAHGHQAGDEVLARFAACLQETIRQQIDWVGRYGGEEFIIVLPETRIVGAVVMAERLRKAVNEAAIEVEDKDIGLTASFGVVGFEHTPPEWIKMEMVVEAAETQLLRAKDEGRDRVMSGPPLEKQFRQEKTPGG